jgi:hypothetical protein
MTSYKGFGSLLSRYSSDSEQKLCMQAALVTTSFSLHGFSQLRLFCVLPQICTADMSWYRVVMMDFQRQL